MGGGAVECGVIINLISRLALIIPVNQISHDKRVQAWMRKRNLGARSMFFIFLL